MLGQSSFVVHPFDPLDARDRHPYLRLEPAAVPGNQIGLLVNRYQPSDPIKLKEIEKTLGIPVFWTLSNDFEAVMNSINQGKPIVLQDKSAYAKDLKGFVTALTGISAPAEDGKGLFDSLGRPLKKIFNRSNA